MVKTRTILVEYLKTIETVIVWLSERLQTKGEYYESPVLGYSREEEPRFEVLSMYS